MSFSGVVVESSMNVTFPTLMGEFGISTAVVQWITTGYLLVLSIIIPTSSYLRRRFTMRTLFIVGASCFLAGTLAAALAPAFPVLLAGRLVQGVGTGVALPLMFNIILEQVPRKSMGLMIGIANFITSTAPAIGPSLGGFLLGAARGVLGARAARSRVVRYGGRVHSAGGEARALVARHLRPYRACHRLCLLYLRGQ